MSQRFVIHKHTRGEDIHWDLMIESGDVLKTWRLDNPPGKITSEKTKATPIQDHDKKFLSYQGPVNNGTGTVELVDEGMCETDNDFSKISFEGKIITGKFTIFYDKSNNLYLKSIQNFNRTTKRIEYKFSSQEIESIQHLLNEFLNNISLVTLSRSEAEIANPDECFIQQNEKYHNIVKVINRWGIKDENGKYNESLNNIIGKISLCRPMLQPYEFIEFLLFNKMMEWGKNVNAKFTKEELEVFFLQPFDSIIDNNLPYAGIHLNDIIIESHRYVNELDSDHSKEFLNEGVGRRLFMLKANIDSISKIYNENRRKPLNEEENAILAQNINFFYANIHGILDCLAFVFAFESPDYIINRVNIKELKKVNLFDANFYNKIANLNDKLELQKLKFWYKEIIDLRHPIAHRIPLYFPEMYNSKDALEIQKLENKYYEDYNALLKNETITLNDKYSQLTKLDKDYHEAKENINTFSGCFTHSHLESKKLYHLSRLPFDLGILFFLLDKSLEYLFENN